MAFVVVQTVQNIPAMQESRVQSLSWQDPLGKGVATPSSILAWRTPWTEGPAELHFMGSQRVGYYGVPNSNTNKRKTRHLTEKQEGNHEPRSSVS